MIVYVEKKKHPNLQNISHNYKWVEEVHRMQYRAQKPACSPHARWGIQRPVNPHVKPLRPTTGNDKGSTPQTRAQSMHHRLSGDLLQGLRPPGQLGSCVPLSSNLGTPIWGSSPQVLLPRPPVEGFGGILKTLFSVLTQWVVTALYSQPSPAPPRRQVHKTTGPLCLGLLQQWEHPTSALAHHPAWCRSLGDSGMREPGRPALGLPALPSQQSADVLTLSLPRGLCHHQLPWHLALSSLSSAELLSNELSEFEIKKNAF